MSQQETPTKSLKQRPYWHVDLKWMFGISLFFSLGASLLFLNLATITQKDHAITLSANIVAGLFSKNGLDDESGLAEFRQKAASTPGETVAPIDQFPWLQISKRDALTLSPRDLRTVIFSKLTEPIYDKGVSGAAADIASDAAQQQTFVQQATFLNIFTRSTHDIFQALFLITAITSLLFLAGLIWFSAGWGRLVSPALIFLLVSPIGIVMGLLLLYPPTDGNSALSQIPPAVAQDIGNGLYSSYMLAAGGGSLLLIAAATGKLIHTIVRHRQHNQRTS